LNGCGFCGRENEENSRFCIDCGKPIVAGGARVISVASILNPSGAQLAVEGGARGSQPRPVPSTRVSETAPPEGGVLKQCPGCRAMLDPSLPFCPQCGYRVGPAPATAAVCTSCGSAIKPGVDKFCAKCGARAPTSNEAPSLAPPSGTAVFTAKGTGTGPRLALLNAAGETAQTFLIDRGEATIGRSDGELRFADDVYLSPVHAQVAMRDGQLFVRDLGSRNGTWLFIDGPTRLQDGDTILIGSQLLRFRRLGYPGPHPPEADQTRRLGSFTPSADIAVLAQLRADGSARDTFHLSPGRSVKIGRDHGDWIFPYDQTMSGKHAEVRSEDLEFIVMDDGSRNGVAIAVRGEKPVKQGQKILMGDQTLRVESL
jgi:pSer/pThr/pTyr-binding forkhead associated (FHA) protein